MTLKKFFFVSSLVDVLVSNARVNTNTDFLKDINEYMQHIVAKDLDATASSADSPEVLVENEFKSIYNIKINDTEVILLENHCLDISPALVAKVNFRLKITS